MAEMNNTHAVTNQSAIATPIFTLWYGQKNITQDIAPYVTRISYQDSIDNASDTLDIELDDTEGKWRDAWYPNKRDNLRLKLGYQGETLLSCGTFSIDDIEISGPPSVVVIRAVATSVGKALRTASHRGFEDTTLAAIAQRIAKKHQLTLVGQIEPLRIDRVTQYAETDVAFLKRLASEYGYAVKILSDQLIFSHLDQLRHQTPIIQLTPQDVARFSLRDTLNCVYKAAKLKSQDSSNKKLIVYDAEGGSHESVDTLNVQGRAPDKDSAKTKTDAALAKHNEYQQSGSLTLMGNTRLGAGNKIALQDFGQLSGDWLITAARHSLERQSGYVTELEIARGPLTQGTAKKNLPKKLRVYKPDDIPGKSP